MEDYAIIGWPEIQEYMSLEGFRENSALITPNPHIGIGSGTYLIDLGWLASLEEEED